MTRLFLLTAPAEAPIHTITFSAPTGQPARACAEEETMNPALTRLAALSWTGLALAVPLRAGNDETEIIGALCAQIDALDEKIRILERKQELADESNTAAFKKSPTSAPTAAGCA